MNKSLAISFLISLLFVNNVSSTENGLTKCKGFDFSDSIEEAYLKDSKGDIVQVRLPKPYLMTPTTAIFYRIDGDGQAVAQLDRETRQPPKSDYMKHKTSYDSRLKLLVSRHFPLETILGNFLGKDYKNKLEDTVKSNGVNGVYSLVHYNSNNISPSFDVYSNVGEALTDVIICNKTMSDFRYCDHNTMIGGLDVEMSYSKNILEFWKENKSIASDFVECIKK